MDLVKESGSFENSDHLDLFHNQLLTEVINQTLTFKKIPKNSIYSAAESW